jgi:hypothetical protein
VIYGGQCHINYNCEDVKSVFFDHELIRSLGCESSINVPVRYDGVTYGTLNLLNETNWYGEADSPVLSVFASIAAPVVLQIVRERK